tara:strand:- start:5658 stop:6011 length:354 start_codon:yes stop_codon:yes gene_type:complete
MFEEPRRARRIRQTRQIAFRRRSDRLNRWFWGEIPEDFDVWAVGYFAKAKGLGCQACSSRRKGRPKISGGMCKHGVRHRIYELRRQSRALRELARRSGVNWEADDVALLCSPVKTWE